MYSSPTVRAEILGRWSECGFDLGFWLSTLLCFLWWFGYLSRWQGFSRTQLGPALDAQTHPRSSILLIPLILIYSSINFLSGNPLNRASWLRSSPIILNSTAHSPHTRWLLFNAGDPLVRTSTGALALLSASALGPIFAWRAGADGRGSDDAFKAGGVDERTVFGQVYVPPDERKGRHGGEFADMMTARVTPAPVVVFLGILESSSSSSNPPAVQVGAGVAGVPYFALDVAGTGKEQDILGLKLEGEDSEIAWGPARVVSASLTREDAAIFGEAKSMLDWNARNKVRTFPPHSPSRS